MMSKYLLSDRSGVKLYYDEDAAAAANFDALPEVAKDEWLEQHGIKPPQQVEYKLHDGRTILTAVCNIVTLQSQNPKTQNRQADYFLGKGQARLVTGPKANGSTPKADSASVLTSDNPNVAHKLVDCSEHLPPDSAVANYLRNRGIDPEKLPPCIYGRPHKFKGAASSLVGLAFNDKNKVSAMVEVYVTHDGKKAPPLSRTDDDGKEVVIIPESSKRTTGHIKGNPIKMGQGPLVLCEGLEDALSIYQNVPDHEVWCVCGVDNLAAALVPANTTVTICSDGDDVDSAAAGKLKRAISRFQARGCTVLVTQTPPGQDANSIGGEALRRLIDEAVPAERAEDTGGGADSAEPDAAPQQIEFVSLFPYNAAAIPLRQWVIPGFAARGEVSLLAGHGGGAKSLLMTTTALACIVEVTFGPWTPQRPLDGRALKVAIVNMEDERNDILRRIDAALHTSIFDKVDATDEALGGRLMLLQAAGQVKFVAYDPEEGITRTAAYHDVERQLREMKPDLIIFDPLVEFTTGIDENSAMMSELHAAFRDIARDLNAAVVAVHHFNKSGSAENQNSARGSSALGAGARTVVGVERCNAADGDKWNIPPEQRPQYIKVYTSKANYGVAGTESWFRLVQRQITNGEWIVAAEPWTPQPLMLSLEKVNAILDDIEKGRGEGMLYSLKETARKDVAAVAMIKERHSLTLDQAKALLQQLVEEGMVGSGDYTTPDRHTLQGAKVRRRPKAWPPIEELRGTLV